MPIEVRGRSRIERVVVRVERAKWREYLQY
jgi:hypothetical protein